MLNRAIIIFILYNVLIGILLVTHVIDYIISTPLTIVGFTYFTIYALQLKKRKEKEKAAQESEK